MKPKRKEHRQERKETVQNESKQYSPESQQIEQKTNERVLRPNRNNSDDIRPSFTRFTKEEQLRQRLCTKIECLEPILCDEITSMLLDKYKSADLHGLLGNKEGLKRKVCESRALLKDYYRKVDVYKPQQSNTRHTTLNNNCDSFRTNSNYNEVASILSVPNSVSSCTPSQCSLKSYISSNRSDDTKCDDICTFNGLPPECTVQTVRLIINAPICKPMLHALLQKKCIANATFECIKQIYVRCHKSYFHPNGDVTVVYIHFINFEDYDYIKCGYDDLFNFNRNRNRNIPNIFDLMGNRFGCISLMEYVRDYPLIRVPVDYLSKLVRICLRCKLNECDQRKRVCKYCIKEEIEDRKKIADYYHNSVGNSNASLFDIKHDLIELKIEAHLIPLPIYKTDCPKKAKCTRNQCTFVHNQYEKQFGAQLMKIQRDANKERYSQLMSNSLDYGMINIQMKYRRIICRYYEKHWKQHGVLVNNEGNMNVIKADLITNGVESLHLIPRVYRANCNEDKCRMRCGKKCAFIHDPKERTFGDILWKIKCFAKDAFENESVCSGASAAGNDGMIVFNADLFGDNKEEKHYEWNRSPIEREWGLAIRPYAEAVMDEKEAEIKELNKWTMDGANISIKMEQMNKSGNASQRIYGLFVEYEDDKDAEIVMSRTYVQFTFDRKYDVGLRTVTADKNKESKKLRNKDCPACYFNVCSGGHWQLMHAHNGYKTKSKRSKCDVLTGVVVEKLKSNRYKVLIKSGFKKGDAVMWLKFAIIAHNKFNTKQGKQFSNVLIRYNPSEQYDKIYRALKRLDEEKTMERTLLSHIFFGIEGTMPLLMDDYNVNYKAIKRIFAWLNKSQIKAICGALNYNMHCIQGPPGCGKTIVCAHIAYLWWYYKRSSKDKVKIHGICPTNKGAQVLAMKCMEMNKKMTHRLKVVYFASNTYVDFIYDEYDDNFNLSTVCVNIMAERKLKALRAYGNMDKLKQKEWRNAYIKKELENADIICTTFGNSLHPFMKDIHFTHAVCDESNQASLETFLGIINSDIQYLTMAGDNMQLQPVIKSDNVLAKKSIYSDIVSYLTNDTTEYYTLLNTQYRSHPQIYGITTQLFYNNRVIINEAMKSKRAYTKRHNYGALFANQKNRIQFHIYGEKQSDTLSLNRSKCNRFEAEIALKYIRKFVIELGNNENDIAVISDYKGQKDYVYKLLCDEEGIKADDILLCTTNTIEGSSKPVVIYMCCRSNNCGNIGFLTDITRLNVATSRAQYAQIIIADINTLQYNPIYNKLFEYHEARDAVVCNDKQWIKRVVPLVPLINISNEKVYKNTRNDYHKCRGCSDMISDKLFCGKMTSSSAFCQECMHRYLLKYCQSKRLRSEYPEITSATIINKSDFYSIDSGGIISLEFDTILGQYLMRNGLITFCNENELSRKLCDVAMKICGDLRGSRYIAQCFRDLVCAYKMNGHKNKEYYDKLNEDGTSTANALGIMRCKRNHLLQQSMYDTRFFQVVNKIKYNNKELKVYYNQNRKSFYKFKEFKDVQPTLIAVAYLQSCGYSMHSSNRLKKRIGKALSTKNMNEIRKSKYRNPIRLNETEINKFAHELCSDESQGIRNVLSMNRIFDIAKFSRYVIELMQNAIIADCMSTYYQQLKHEIAIHKENDFGDKLTQAGFEYVSENELKENGFKETPDYYLKKPWIITYNEKQTEITWLDFKYFYCSATPWCIDKLNAQATRYNRRFGPGAFVFSLGFVQPPKEIQMASYGLLAAIPLTKRHVLRFIEKQSNV